MTHKRLLILAILLLSLTLNAGCASIAGEFSVKEGEDIVWLKTGETITFTPKVDSAIVSRRYWKFQQELCK